MLLPLSYFQNENVVHLAKDLIGKLLVSEIDGIRTSGIIVETEAYRGADDKACHAYGYKRTPRTETMFKPGGHAYVYLCYGIHSLFNIVVNKENEPDAVLIRALEPLEGLDGMMARRPGIAIPRLASGPGCVTKALGISIANNGLPLRPLSGVWIEEFPDEKLPFVRKEGTRIGVEYAGEDASRLWRFMASGHPSVSRL